MNHSSSGIVATPLGSLMLCAVKVISVLVPSVAYSASREQNAATPDGRVLPAGRGFRVF